ncbi:sensor histidine kinase [Lachnospiraceae bacterium 45-W7]
MKSLKNWIMRLSIRKKLIFYSYLIIVPILFVISACLVFQNYQLAVKEHEENCVQSIQRLSDNLEVVQKNIVELATYICINENIRQILTCGNPAELNRDARFWVNNAPMRMVQDMVAIGGVVKTVAIYPENGVNPYLKCIDYASYIADMEQVQKENIYLLTVQKKGEFLWQRVGKDQSDTYEFNYNDKIVMYHEIYDLARKEKLGYVVLGSAAEVFDEICRDDLQNKDETVLIMSEYGAELARCGTVDDDMMEEILERSCTQPTAKEDIYISTWGNYKVYCCQSRETGVKVYKVTSKVRVLDVADSIIYAPLALLLAFLAGLCPVMFLVSNIVSKPLHKLGAAMDKFKNGDFSQKIEVVTFDEVGKASMCFNSMVDNIRELINNNYILALKEKQSELDALQAQINPHFLYNTLDSLYWKAVEAEDEEIAEDILSLSQMFRLVLNQGDSIVTVKIEMELLERYLHIQKMRFGKRFEYEIQIEQAMMAEEIPKLILQPFVENAIVHGFEKGENPFFLSIRGQKREGCLHFQIHDTGIGMSSQQMEAIWEKEEDPEHSSHRIGKYAIRNVKERMELIYHEDYELVIESEEGRGTTVRITIPSGLN